MTLLPPGVKVHLLATSEKAASKCTPALPSWPAEA